ncbi:MAG: hypothetical protein ABR537_04915 [Gemmatimonadales bacterium]
MAFDVEGIARGDPELVALLRPRSAPAEDPPLIRWVAIAARLGAAVFLLLRDSR